MFPDRQFAPAPPEVAVRWIRECDARSSGLEKFIPVSDIPSRSTGSRPKTLEMRSNSLTSSGAEPEVKRRMWLKSKGLSPRTSINLVYMAGTAMKHRTDGIAGVAGKFGDHGFRIELIEHAHMGAAEKRRVHGKAQPVNMKQRQGVTQHIFFRKSPDTDDVAGIIDQVSVGQDRSLGVAGGPGGVDNQGPDHPV